MNLYLNVATMSWREKTPKPRQNSGALAGSGSAFKNCRSATIEHVALAVGAHIICTPEWFISVLLHLSLSTPYWSSSTNEMSDLAAWVSRKMEFFLSLLAVYVILPRCIKPTHAIINAASMFRSSSYFIGWAIIFTKMSFVIGKRVDFTLGNNIFTFLII